MLWLGTALGFEDDVDKHDSWKSFDVIAVNLVFMPDRGELVSMEWFGCSNEGGEVLREVWEC